MAVVKTRRLGEILLEAGLVTPEKRSLRCPPFLAAS